MRSTQTGGQITRGLLFLSLGVFVPGILALVAGQAIIAGTDRSHALVAAAAAFVVTLLGSVVLDAVRSLLSKVAIAGILVFAGLVSLIIVTHFRVWWAFATGVIIFGLTNALMAQRRAR